ncbi:MAG: type I-B CRISPR-associated protein Cas8b1/Cst1 [Bacillota bacterium]
MILRNEKKIELRLSNIFKNAAILGFYKVIRDYDEIEIDQNRIIFPYNVFHDFTEKYIKANLNEFYTRTIHFELVNRLDYLKTVDLNNDENKEKVNATLKYIKDKLNRNSYQAGYKIIKDNNPKETRKIDNLIKKISVDNFTESNELLGDIQNYLNKYKETLAMKDIIYTVIGKYWENLAFLNRQSSKKDIKTIYESTFLDGINEFLEDDIGPGNQCICCHTPIKTKHGRPNSFIIDKGADANRKRSHFWNFKPDSYLCPVCAIIYSCMHLGFVNFGNNAIFINNNYDFDDLESINNTAELKSLDMADNRLSELYRYLTRLLNESFKSLSNEINNIQVAMKISHNDKMRYLFNIISKDKLTIMEKRKKEFERVVKINTRVKDRYAYDIFVENFFGGVNQYMLIDEIIRNSLNSNRTFAISSITEAILLVQNETGFVFYKEGELRKGGRIVAIRDIREMKKAGSLMRYRFKTNSDNIKDVDNKIRSYVYHLLNSLKTNNNEDFMDVVLRMYAGLGLTVPEQFIKMLEYENQFKVLGYAYIIGLKNDSFEQNPKEEKE